MHQPIRDAMRRACSVASISGAAYHAPCAGESAGAPTFGPGAFPAHRKGLPREWKLLENLANTAALGQRRCVLYVGAMNHIGGGAGWARIFASCAR